MSNGSPASPGPTRSALSPGAILLLVLTLLAGCRERSPVEPQLDLTGSWTLTVDGVCTGGIDMTQTGRDFTVGGSVGGTFCPFSAAGDGNGTLDGRTITFGIGFGSGSAAGGTGLGTVTFQGSVEAGGNRMGGTYAGSMSGQWEAVRR